MRLIKSPFSFSGNKYRLLNKGLSNLIQCEGEIFDIGCGSGAIIYNSNGGEAWDIDPGIISLHNFLKYEGAVPFIQEVYDTWFPEGGNKHDYMRLRKKENKIYNSSKRYSYAHSAVLFVLISLSFNSLIRFGPRGYNVSFGMKEFNIGRIKVASERSRRLDLTFRQKNFRALTPDMVRDEDLIYFDPPYLVSKYKYGGWTLEDEQDMYSMLDNADALGKRFVLSNVFRYRGENNTLLQEWVRQKGYTVHCFDVSYNAWAAAVKDVEYNNDTIEVAITNARP